MADSRSWILCLSLLSPSLFGLYDRPPAPAEGEVRPGPDPFGELDRAGIAIVGWVRNARGLDDVSE